MVLVFSDEFNKEGRSFYPGDDPFWEAVDLHYWGTVSSVLEMIYDFFGGRAWDREEEKLTATFVNCGTERPGVV